ncbi:hypothetical protein [Shinella oryzae]|uniref:Uncharacterized protein n=1 Tax=Shinella oryzae TaxID=2871820 RepID=A0ABY9KDY6_9HYPH|nr:hypothetical protein [Shinella oryzae]WLS05121.1 hypothetical protein Q9315_23440 [Shinella oryzae]
MNTAFSANFGRIVIVLAVLLQAIGKVMFGTWLSDIPSHLFVLISFSLTAALSLPYRAKASENRHGRRCYCSTLPRRLPS